LPARDGANLAGIPNSASLPEIAGMPPARNIHFTGSIILLTASTAFPLFNDLAIYPIRIWDEARSAVSAQEFLANGNWLTPTIHGQPDLWNVKPPLLPWLQAAFMAVLGENELAVRLPSALAAWFLCIALFIFFHKALKAYRAGLFAAVVLASSPGFVFEHAARSGDYDALLALFSTGAVLAFFGLVESKKGFVKNRMAMAFCGCLMLGVLAKGISILLFSPAFMLILLLRKKFIAVAGNKTLLLSFAGAVVPVLAYYLGREALNPGYLQAVWDNELGGRYFHTLENHRHPAGFYFENIRQIRFKKWFWFLIAALPVCLLEGDRKKRSFARCLIVCIGVYLALISCSRTKLEWYDVPLYPLFAMLIGLGLDTGFRKAASFFPSKNPWITTPLYAGIVFIVFLDPYKTVFGHVYRQKERPWNEERYALSYYLRELSESGIRRITVCHDEYNLHLVFYANRIAAKGGEVTFSDCRKVDPKTPVAVTKDSLERRLLDAYSAELALQREHLSVYRVTGRKN
jgi:4-amino-4-deoxy-L-arabinose transferase-like glycosyltransferase